jgi:hypothetical protein
MSTTSNAHLIRVESVAGPAWPADLTDLIVSLTREVAPLLAAAPPASILIAVVCPAGRGDGSGSVDASVEAVRGFAQSLALEAPSTRCTVAIVGSADEADLQSTFGLFAGDRGGFIAGATFDLRSNA